MPDHESRSTRRARRQGSGSDGSEGSGSDGRRTRWDAHRAARRRQLVEAGLAVLNDVGPAFGIDQVAERAGVTKPVVYRHFADRAGLLGAMGERVVELVISERMMPAITTDLPQRARVRGVIDAFVGFVDDYPNVYWFAVRHEPTVTLAFVRRAKDTIAEALGSVIDSVMTASGRGDVALAEMWAHGLVGFVQNVVETWLDRGTTSRETLVEHLTVLVWVQMEGFARANGVVLDPDARLDLDDVARQVTAPRA